MLYFTKIPQLIRQYYSAYIWSLPEKKEKEVYLTFDDGPCPEVTDWVLQCLKGYKASATFFFIGQNVELYPELAHAVIDSGHCIGNHTFSHRNGWKTDSRSYLRDFLKGQKAIQEYTGYQAYLFRPPYGRISRSQAKHVLRTHKIIMMDVMSGDFDTSLSGMECYKNVIRNVEPGSIIVFHDSEKAWPRLKEALPKVLEDLDSQGYRFKSLQNLKE